jgi:hypothetical protein
MPIFANSPGSPIPGQHLAYAFVAGMFASDCSDNLRERIERTRQQKDISLFFVAT